MSRGQITEKVSWYPKDGLLVNFLDGVMDRVATVPEDKRAGLKVELSADDWGEQPHSVEITISYKRDVTEADERAREERAENFANLKRKRELAELRRLTTVYGAIS